MGESGCREIITLQIGTYSNFIGTHWFNIQQQYLTEDSEFNPGVLWRQGLSPQRKHIWTPRVLIFDMNKASSHLDALNLDNLPLNNPGEEFFWDGKVETVSQADEIDTDISEDKVNAGHDKKTSTQKPPTDIKEDNPSKPKTPKINEDSINWSGFATWKLHSTAKAAFSLPNFSHNSTSGELFNFDQGVEIYKTLDEGVKDGIRHYVEECDYFEGFQLLVDQNDGFGGMSNGILEHIADEYKKSSCLTLGMSRAGTKGWGKETAVDFKLRVFNSALAWNSFSQYSSAFSSLGLCEDFCKPRPKPKDFPLLHYKVNSDYESSAVLAACLDTLTGSYRLRSPTLTLHELLGLLSGYERKMAAFGSAFPLSLVGKEGKEETLFKILTDNGLDMLSSLCPGIPKIDPVKATGNFFIMRGVPADNIISERERASQMSALRNLQNAQSCLEMYSQEVYSKSVNVVRGFETPFNLAHPFPINLVDPDFLATKPKRTFKRQDSWQIPAVGSAHNTSEVGDLLEKMISEAQMDKMKRNFNWGQTSVESDDYVECINNLRTLRTNYN